MRPWLLLAVLAPAALAAQSPLDSAARLIERRQFAAAKPLLAEASAASPADARVAFWLGRVAYGEQDFEPAVKHLERAVSLDPTSSVYHMWLGRAYGRHAQRANVLRQMGLARKAKGAMERAVALDPENVSARRDLMEYYLAAPKIAGGSMDRAKGELAEIRRRDAYLGHFAAARIAEAEGDTAAGVREYEAAIALTPDSAGPYYRLGNILTARRQWADAFALYDRLLARRPGEATALYSIGRTGALSGERLDQAADGLARYIAAPDPEGPSLAAAHWRLGNVREKQGRKDDARREYETALRIDPKFKDARASLDKLR